MLRRETRRRKKGADREEPLDHEIVVLLQSAAVGIAERISELLLGIFLDFLEPQASKGVPAKEPHEALRRRPLLLALLIFHQLFDGAGQRRCLVVPRTEFL
jgi:hypothetical protein